MEMFRGAAGVDMTHIPYKGGPPALTDLIGGQVNVMFETSVAALPFVKQGKLRALAVSSSKRIAAAPDLPTVAELGYPGFSGVPWVAIVAPANTPAPIVAKLNAEVNKALNSKEIREQFVAQGVEPMQMSPDELGAIHQDRARQVDQGGQGLRREGRIMESMLAPADTIARTLSGFVSRMRLDQVPAAGQPARASPDARRDRLCTGGARKEQFARSYSQATHALPKGNGERAVIGFSGATCRSATQRCSTACCPMDSTTTTRT